MTILIRKGIYLWGLFCTAARLVDFHTHFPNLKSSCRGLNSVHSSIPSRRSQQHIAPSSLHPWKCLSLWAQWRECHFLSTKERWGASNCSGLVLRSADSQVLLMMTSATSVTEMNHWVKYSFLELYLSALLLVLSGQRWSNFSIQPLFYIPFLTFSKNLERKEDDSLANKPKIKNWVNVSKEGINTS